MTNSKSFKKTCFSFIIILSLLSSHIHSSPKIEVDSTHFHFGTVYEDETVKVKHDFRIRNTGDDTLKIQRVKPGCGCTVVEFDSIIPPGQAGKVTQEVNIKGMNHKDVTKSIIVTSNAGNAPELRLALGVTIFHHVRVSTNYVRLVSAGEDMGKAQIYLSSAKRDLKIKDVKFKAQESNDKPIWQINFAKDINYSVENINSADEEGYYNYILNLSFYTSDEEPQHGVFIIKTNHPKKPEIYIRGMVQNIPRTKNQNSVRQTVKEPTTH